MRHATSFAILLALALPAAAQDPKVEEFAPRASGVALAEVVAVEKFDGRRVDGPAGVKFKLKRVRGSGDFLATIMVVTEPGGLQPPGTEFKPSAPVKDDSLKKGERWWFAFASVHENEKYDEGVIGFWPEKDKKAEALEAAVKADAYKWHPQYDPETKLTYGRIVGKEKWQVRVQKGGKTLWEKELLGLETKSSLDWDLRDNAGGELDVKMPKCGKMLFAELDVLLEKGNEFGLESGQYYRVTTGFDPETSKRLAAWVCEPSLSQVNIVSRRYDPDSGKATFEQRFDFLKAGGKAAGAETEEWYRKVERTFDAAGKVTREGTFRYDPAAEAGKRWVKVK